MSGTSAIGTAPPATLGRRHRLDHGRDHGRAAGRQHPVHRDRGADHPRDGQRHPGRLDRLHPRPQGPAGTVLQTIDTGTSPEIITQALATAGTYTFEVSGFQGDLGDFTFTIQHVIGGPITAVVLTAKAWGHEGGDLVTAEFKNPGATTRR